MSHRSHVNKDRSEVTLAMGEPLILNSFALEKDPWKQLMDMPSRTQDGA